MEFDADDIVARKSRLDAETTSLREAERRYDVEAERSRSLAMARDDSPESRHAVVIITSAMRITFGVITTVLGALLVAVVQLVWSNQQRLVVVETTLKAEIEARKEMIISIREINSELGARREYYDNMNDILRRDIQRDIDDIRRRISSH